MDDIAKLLGISKKTIYSSITNKKDLVLAVVNSFIEDEEKTITVIIKNSTNAVDEIISIAIHVEKTIKSMKPSLTYDLKKYHPKAWAQIDKDHFSFIENRIVQNIKRGTQEGYYRENLEAEIISKLYVTLSRSVADDAIFDHNQYSLISLHENVTMYHLNGILNHKGRKELTKLMKKSSL